MGQTLGGNSKRGAQEAKKGEPISKEKKYICVRTPPTGVLWSAEDDMNQLLLLFRGGGTVKEVSEILEGTEKWTDGESSGTKTYSVLFEKTKAQNKRIRRNIDRMLVGAVGDGYLKECE